MVSVTDLFSRPQAKPWCRRNADEENLAGKAIIKGEKGLTAQRSRWLAQWFYNKRLGDTVGARGLQQQQAVGGVQGDKLAADMPLPQSAGILVLPGDPDPGVNGHHALVGVGQVNGNQTRTRHGQFVMRMQHHAAGGDIAQVTDYLAAGMVIDFGQRDEAGAP